MQYMDVPGFLFSLALFDLLFADGGAGSLSNARNRLHRGEIYSGLKCRKEGYIFSI